MIGQEEKQMIIGLLPFLSKDPIVFDVGSNKGAFSDIILEEFKDECMLFLFEPNEKLLSFTEIKYEYQRNIIFENVAAYKTSGELPFHFFENFNNELSSIYKGGDDWVGLPVKTKKVKTETVDKYCLLHNINKIDYLKIDCEGSDADVLEGCKDLMKAGVIKIIQIEYSEHYKRANRTIQDVFYIAKEAGYYVYNFIEGNYWQIKDAWSLMKPDNYILTKEEIHNYSADGGWMNPFILSVCDLPKFDLMLEVGAYEGITTKYMCKNMLNEGGRVIVVDPLMDVYIKGDTDHPYFKGQYQRFVRNTRGLPVELYRGDSDDELPKLAALKVDFAYIDGNHHFPYVYNDSVNVFNMTKNGGFILFDDYLWKDDTTMGIDKFLAEYEKCVRIISKGYQLLIQKIIDP